MFINHLKSFLGPNLDYTDIIYDKPLNKSFKSKIGMVQFNAVLVRTGDFKVTSSDKVVKELV